MLEKGKISPRQTAELMFIAILGTAILLIPAIAAETAGQDAWLAILLGASVGFTSLSLLSWLGHKHPGKTLFEYAETILGRWPGKLVGLLYIAGFLLITAIIVREFGDFMTTSFMPNTPLTVFSISLLFLTAWSVIAGLEVIARMNEFIIVLVIVFLVGVILLSVSNWDLNHLLPFMKQGVLPIVRASAVPAVFTGEIILLAVILPYITRPGRAFISGIAAITGSVIMLTSGVVAALAIFGAELVATFSFPLHQFVRTINIGQLLSRFEVIVMVTWFAGVFIKASIFYYCASLGLAQVFKLKEYRPVVLPLGIIIGVGSISFFPSVVHVKEFLSKTAPLLFIPVYFLGLPLLLVCVTLIREKFFGCDFSRSQTKSTSKE